MSFWDRFDVLVFTALLAGLTGSCISSCFVSSPPPSNPEAVRLRQETRNAHEATAACLSELVTARAVTQNAEKRLHQCWAHQ